MSQAFLQRIAQRCRDCPALIVWALTDKGKRMPVDLHPDVAGNVAVRVDGAQTVRARVVTADLPVAPYEQLHLPHFATCAQRTAPRQPLHTGDGAQVIPIYRARARRARDAQG